MRLSLACLGALLLVACGVAEFTPPPDDAANGVDASIDAPPVDAPPIDAIFDASPMDAPRSDRTGGDIPAARDSTQPTCPPDCRTNADCESCPRSFDSNYCCVSGLCLFVTARTCEAIVTPSRPEIDDPPLGREEGRWDASWPDDVAGDAFDATPGDRPRADMDSSLPNDVPGDVANDLTRGDEAR